MKNFKKALALVLVVALSVGAGIMGTLAYLQDEDSDVNVMTLGNVSIKQHEYERVEGATETIDGVTSYVLQPFTQGKPLLPIVGDPSLPGNNPGYAGWDSIPVRMTQVDSYGGMDVFAGKNAQDKFVVVENTGLTSAYVRTIVAIEAGSTNGSLIGASYHGTWTENEIGIVTIGGNNYIVIEYTYAGAPGIRHEGGILPAGDTAYPNLSQVYIKSAATNEDCKAIDGNGNGTLDILVLSQAVQAAGFANAKTALDTAFGETATNAAAWFGTNTLVGAGSDDEFENAVTGDNETIVVNLTDDVTYDVAAWANDAMGGVNTKEIIINGFGHTITFNQTNSDWNNITTNGAKLVINNAHITNAGKNNGPWNRHDLNFACEVELNNVTSDKALAFKSGATLNNVVINDANTSDTYAIWIQPNGQTVTLNNVLIDMIACADGRGIKIDEQYVSDPKHVTLNVSNTTFKTEEKSAILVKSAAGATINLDNVDIYGVAADPINAVWIDEDAAAHADLVTVNGGNKIVEGKVDILSATDKSGMKNAIKAAVNSGETEVVINLQGATIDMSYGLNTSIVPAGTTVTIVNANVTGKSYGNSVAGTVIFENCTFENANGAYSIHFDAGSGNVVFNNCTLTGWCSFGSAIKSVEMNNCTIKGNGYYGIVRFYQDAVMNNCTIDCSNADHNDAFPDGVSAVSGAKVNMYNCTLVYIDLETENGAIISDNVTLLNTVDHTLVPNA